jgi:cell division protein FtsQ
MPVRFRLGRSIARVEALALPSRAPWPELHPGEWLQRLAPTRRSVAVGVGLVALCLCAYLTARETSLFAVDRIEVVGAPAPVAAQVRHALASVTGSPLVGFDGTAALRKVDALPTVVRATYDRDFPHTLRIRVVPERPAAVLRSGAASWLVSGRGRVVARLSATKLPKLPRIWLPSRASVRLGAKLTGSGAAVAAHAVGLAGTFAPRVGSASYANGALVFRMRSGLQLLLGGEGDVKLKLAVAARVLTVLPAGSTFLDVSNPGRPVSGIGTPLIPRS